MVNYKMSPNFLLVRSSLPDVRDIDAYIFWSLSFSPFLHARLPFLLKLTWFFRLSLSFGGFRHFEISWSSYPHPKHLRGVRSVCLSSEASIARDFFVFLSHPFETFFCRVICTSTKCALCLNIMCSITSSTKNWAAIKI